MQVIEEENELASTAGIEQASTSAVQDAAPKKTIAKRTRRPKVVVVGAGFGGLNAARTLAGKGVDVLVLDKNNYHGFWPLLYQVATAGVEPESIAYPVRAIFRKWDNIRFQMSRVEGIDFEKKQVLTDGEPVSYDYVIIAAGSSNNYFGNNALAEHTIGLKDIDEAEELRNRLLYSFEQAVCEEDPEKRRALMTFVIIGGGPTGVELAGALSELINHVLRKDYPMLDVSEARVILVEAMGSILLAFPESLQKSGLATLKKLGVEVRLNSPVESVGEHSVTFKDGTGLPASLVVWAAGVRAADLSDKLEVKRERGARVRVTPELNLADHPEVFVIGDMSYLETYEDGQAYPMVAQVAIQQGKRAARNILLRANGRPMRPFRYFDQGTMATIGRRAAVMDAFGLKLSGRIAWFGWLLIHIIYLIGFRNRIIVLMNWAVNYFTYDRAVRLITDRKWKR